MPPPPRDNTVLGYRRNGKQQACEPCRKGKLACDHASPFCGRCTRRKTTARCIYHPAPMTKKAGPGPLPSPREAPSVSSDQSGPLLSPRSQSSGIIHPKFFSNPFDEVNTESHGQGTPDAQAAVSGNTRPLCPRYSVFGEQYGQPKAGWKDAVFPRSARYYGSTSYSAIFSEHQVKLNEELLDIGEETRRHPGAWIAGVPLLGRNRPTSPTIRERQTIKALWNIPPKEVCALLLKPKIGQAARVPTLESSMVQHFNDLLWQNFEAALTFPRTDDGLKVVSDALFTNEERPLPPSPDDGGTSESPF